MDKVKKAFTMLFVLVLMMANLPALASALEQTKDISDMLSAKAELQTQEDGNWTALKDQAEVEKGVALKLKVDYTISAEQLEKAVDQASQLEAAIALPSGADFVTDQADNHGTITASDEKTAIGAYNVATASNGAQVLKLSLKSEEVAKAKIGELKASATLNATLKDPQEKQTLKFDSEKIQFSNTNSAEIQLNVPSAKESASTTETPATSSTSSTSSANVVKSKEAVKADDAPTGTTELTPDIMTIVTPATVYTIDSNGVKHVVNSGSTLNVGDQIQIQLKYFLTKEQVQNIVGGQDTVDLKLTVTDGFNFALNHPDPIYAIYKGQQEPIGTYEVTTDDAGNKVIRIKYNDFLKTHPDVESLGSQTNPGFMDVNGQVVKKGDDEHIIIDNGGNFNFDIIDPNVDGQSAKLGPLNKYGYREGPNSNVVNWSINVNYSGIVQAETNGKISKQALNGSNVLEDAQFENSIVMDALPVGINFTSLNAYAPVFFYNDETGFIHDGPMDYVKVTPTKLTLASTVTDIKTAHDTVLAAAPGTYAIYTNNSGSQQTATLYNQTVKLDPGQELFLINTGDIGLKSTEVTNGSFATMPIDTYSGTANGFTAGNLLSWQTKISNAITKAQADKAAGNIKYDFNVEKSKAGADKFFQAVDPYYNAGYHFDIKTTADSRFDKIVSGSVNNSVMIGYNDANNKKADYDVDWRKGDSNIDTNIAAGTVLIQKKALNPTVADASTVNGIKFRLTNTDTGATFDATTGDYINSDGTLIHGVAKFDNPDKDGKPLGLPSGHYTIQELADDGTDISDNLYVWDYTLSKYAKASTDDLKFIIDRDHDSSGFAFLLYNPRDSVSVEKQWQDNNSTSRPTSVKVDLIANYEKGTQVVDTQTLSGDNSWKYTWSNLLAVGTSTNTLGKLLSYTVDENPVPDGYTDMISDVVTTPTKDSNGITTSNNYAYTITNSLKQKSISLSVLKDWKDNNDQDGNRPDKITVHLLADGVPAKDSSGNEITYELNAANEWKHTFTDLPQYKADGTTKINYSFTEDTVTGYTPSFTTSTDGALITITNTPQTVNIVGKKTWTGDNAGAIPDSVKVDLLADGVQVDSKTVTGDKTAKDWSYSFGELPKYKNGKLVVYTVKEEAINGFVAKYSQAPLMVSLAAGTTDYTGYKVQFYDNKGAKSGDPVALVKSADGKTWEAVISDTTVTDYNGYSAKLVDKENKETDNLTATLSLDISNTYKMPLPMTGGSGIQKIILIGLSALMISGLYIFWRKRNRKEVA
ncbi:Cna B-type domain-containing protein [Enterococcus hirae]|nr:Cna B-type domain-containing protein [Enterococcus hirae]